MSAYRKIFVRGFEIWVVVGVYPYEKEGPQRIIFDIEIGLEEPEDPFADELSDTLDYDWITQQLREIPEGAPCKLLETLAERFIASAMERPMIQDVKVTIEKPGVSEMGEHRGVELYRSR